jgi:hypothetical protein
MHKKDDDIGTKSALVNENVARIVSGAKSFVGKSAMILKTL